MNFKDLWEPWSMAANVTKLTSTEWEINNLGGKKEHMASDLKTYESETVKIDTKEYFSKFVFMFYTLRLMYHAQQITRLEKPPPNWQT